MKRLRARKRVPTHFRPAPILEAHLLFVWDAFWELNTERPMAFALGPIPGRAIREHAEFTGIVGDAFDGFRTLIRALDAEYLKRNAPSKDKKR